MGRQPDVYLEFALISLRKTVAYMGERTLEDYLADDFCRSAVERELEIAGDALGQLRKTHQDIFLRIPDGAAIVAFRNVLAHGYATLNHRVVYEAASQRARELIRSLEMILDEFPEK
jgi:uncharacterized protein with HEPN domain